MPKGIFDRTKSKPRPPINEEWRRKISIANKGKKKPEGFSLKQSLIRQGKKLTWITAEHREKARLKMIGRKQSPQQIKKTIESRKWYKHSEETKQKLREKLKGRIMSLETREKMSISHKGRKRPPMSDSQKEKISLSRIGKHYPNASGKNSYLWKGGITSINAQIRNSSEYRLWRKAVFERDNYICIWCKVKGGKLNADHIKPFSLFPELRFAIDNGRTLCLECHKKTDSFGWKCQKLLIIK